MSKRLQILTKSLENKESQFNQKLDAHFADVKSANGQPLNDKRNGAATLNRWGKQDDALRNIQKSIAKTKEAIEIEQGKISCVESAKETLPVFILSLIESGELVQWRKHPNIFFVAGVDKARLVWDNENKIIAHKYTKQITDKEQWKKFANTFNSLKHQLATN